MPKDKAMYSIELEKDMMEFMEQMTAQYALPDVSKAMRCLARTKQGQPRHPLYLPADTAPFHFETI